MFDVDMKIAGYDDDLNDDIMMMVTMMMLILGSLPHPPLRSIGSGIPIIGLET